MLSRVEYYNDKGEKTEIPWHCANECPVKEGKYDYEREVYPCGYRHWCPFCGDCEYCYEPGPHEWD